MADAEDRAKVLVAEDDSAVRQLLVEVLRRDGHDVRAVGDAQEAVRLLLRERFSLLIADVAMPGTSGLVLAREIRSRGLRLPILVLSGPREVDLLEGAVLEIGNASALHKPFDLAEFRESIAKLLSGIYPDRPDRADRAQA